MNENYLQKNNYSQLLILKEIILMLLRKTELKKVLRLLKKT